MNSRPTRNDIVRINMRHAVFGTHLCLKEITLCLSERPNVCFYLLTLAVGQAVLIRKTGRHLGPVVACPAATLGDRLALERLLDREVSV